ncbi:MAG: hypothetical protein JST55_15700 [Bacteroidetes bacterium]|nr:hypothetical protein [Bacteroidota bacterium]
MKAINQGLSQGFTTQMAKLTLVMALLAGALFFLSGCNNNPVTTSTTGTGTGTDGDNISLSVQSSDNLGDNSGIVITEAKGLLTEIEVETDSASRQVKAGPIVVQLDVAGINKVMTSGVIPTGTYKKIKFQLHKPEDSETIPDPDFREGSSGNKRYSFIVKGTYNGTSFVYKSKKTINIVMNLTTPLVLQSKSNLTILFDKLKWFTNGSGDLNPNDSGNENEIDDNLKNSFRKAFKDDDKNGVPDDH